MNKGLRFPSSLRVQKNVAGASCPGLALRGETPRLRDRRPCGTPRSDGRPWRATLLGLAAIISFSCIFNSFIPNAEAVQVKKVYRGIATFELGETLQAVPLGGTVDPAKTLVLASNTQSADTSYDRSGFFVAQLSGNDTIQIERGGADGSASTASTASVAWQAIEFADGARVQSGISSMDKGQLSKSITLPPLSPALDVSKSIPFVTFRPTQGTNNTTRWARTHEFFLEPVLSGGASTTLTFNRLEANASAADKAIPLVWQVVEFSTDANVHTGTVCLRVPTVAVGPQSITNDGIDPDGATTNCGTNSGAFSPVLSNGGNNALLFFYPQYGSGLNGEDIRIFTRGTITNSSTATFTRGYAATTALSHVIIRYYVLDLTDGNAGLGFGTMGSAASTSDPARLVVSGSTDAIDPATIQITTSVAHGYAVGDVVMIAGHDTNTAANGTWRIRTVPTTTTFEIEDLLGNIIEGSGAGNGGGTGFVAKLNEVNLNTLFGTVDSTRMVNLISSASQSNTATTNTYADDLRYMGHVHQRSGTWYLEMRRAPDGQAINADYQYFAYEFPVVTVKSPNGGGSALVVDAQTTVTWVAADGAASDDWKLQIFDGVSWVDMSGVTYGTCGATYNLACNKTATGALLSAGSVTWKVPDKIRSDLKIRIWDETLTTADTTCVRRCDSSNTNFTIKGSITSVDTKDGGVSSSILFVDDVDSTVTWSQTGSIGTVKIQIDRNQDGSFTAADDPPLATGVATGASGNYSWAWAPRVSNIVGEILKIRVVSESDGTVFGDSGIIAIRPNVSIFEPTATSQFLRGKTHRIKFCTMGTVGNVKIYLSSNTGVDYNPIDVNGVINGPGSKIITATYAGAPTASCPGTVGIADEGYWDWPVPSGAPLGTTNKIKVEKSDNANVLDTAPDPSAATFEIKASIQLTGPATTDGLRVELDKPISWTVTGGSGVANVSIKYTTSWPTCQNLPSTDLCWVTITTPDASNLLVGASPFQWNVPNIIGTNVGIRIQDTLNPELIYDKSGPFTVKGRIATVTAPSAAELLRVGTNKTIIWDAKGSIGPVDVCLMKEGSTACDFTIATAVALPTESAAWNNIAATEMCTTCEVKVFLPGDPTAENADGTGGVSKKSAIFSVKGNITNAARDTASYNVGGNVAITWAATPATLGDSVRIRYDSNSGLGADGVGGNADDYPTIITTKVASAQSHTWPIPATEPLTNGTSRIKVEYVGYESIFSETTTFSIKGTLTLTGAAKNGGVVWKIGEQNTITWARNGSSMTNADIKYSPDGGTNWNLITTVPSGNETYTWCVGFNDGCSGTGGVAGTADDAAHTPGLVIGADKDTDIKIRIEAVSDPAGIFDCTGASCAALTYLTIQKRYINVAVPSPTLFVGDNSVALSNISWTTQGVTSTAVLLNYDTSSGSGEFLNTIVGTPGASDVGGYVWDVPDAIGTAVRVRMKSSTFPTDVFGDSVDFTVKGKIVPVFPAGTDTLVIGDAVAGGIQYQKKGSVGNLKIEYLRTGCATNLLLTPGPVPGPEGTSNATSFSWTVSAVDNCGLSVIDIGGTKNSKFRFTGLGQTGAMQATVESAGFQIRGKVYDILPNNGEVLQIGGPTFLIKWKANGNVGNVRIRFDKFGGLGADGIGGNADDFATVVTGPNVTYPNGESVPYNFDGDGAGASCDTANPCWEWTIPDLATIQGRIRVESIDNPATLTNGMATFKVSDANFRVRGTVTVSSPNGSQSPQWKVGDTKLITWNTTGTLGTVDVLLLYDDDGAPYANTFSIATGVPAGTGGSGSYNWVNIPTSVVAETAIVRVTQASDSTVTDDSNASFKIKPVLALTAPDNNTFQWVVGTSYNVTWNPPQGSAASLKINFSTNGGKGADGTLGTSDDWPDTDCVANLALCQTNKGGLITASVASAAGTKSWTIPDIMTNEGVVRLSKVGDTETYDDSNSYFYIKGSFTNVQIKNLVADPPPGTPIDLPIDNDKYITWDYAGSLGTVNIYYATDGNLGSPTWTLIPDPDGIGPRTSGAGVSVGSGGNGSYQWKIPNAPSPNVKVKVANVSNPSWQDVSNTSPGLNSIIGSVTEVSVIADGNPTTTDMEVTGNKTIQWKPNGNIPIFKVEYRKNAGTWTEITPPGGCGGTCYTTNVDYRRWVWTNIPDQISNDIDFRVLDYNDPVKVNCASYDASCNPSPVAAYILKGKLSIASPISTDVWTLGTTPSPSIRWNKQGTIGDLKIEYSATGTFTTTDYTNGYVFAIETAYASGVNGNNDYAWVAGVIGANRKISDVGKIKISNITTVTGTELSVTSDAFKIRPSFTSFSSPTLGNIWYVADTTRVITWACNSGTKFDGSLPKTTLEYNVDGGSYLPVTGAGNLDCVNGTNNYTWPSVADEKSNNAAIRVSFNDYSTINLPSAIFKIHPKITVTPTPDATTKLKVGSSYTNLVKWTYT
ncbi:MAG: hypothetical protein HY587_02060, partial [Candidatus Omnitrophica bacterium]|nr:hypothetical protein [Candidatus Omnitrophota bacterium]